MQLAYCVVRATTRAITGAREPTSEHQNTLDAQGSTSRRPIQGVAPPINPHPKGAAHTEVVARSELATKLNPRETRVSFVREHYWFELQLVSDSI